MTLGNSLSVDDLTRELEIGRATVKFILERFSPWLSSQLSNGTNQYSPSVIPLLIRISDLLSSGMLPSQIEEILENDIRKIPPEDSGRDIRMNQDALSFIREMVTEIRGHQGRIATAHEKRAHAEERKAAAIEKRAQAEEKKAMAMNNIAMALQEMGRMRQVDSQTMQIAGQAAQALTMDETRKPADHSNAVDLNGNDLDRDDLEPDDLDSGSLDLDPQDEWKDEFEDPLAGMAELLDHPEPDPTPINSGDIDASTPDIDDLSLLLPDSGLSERDLDDLSSLIDTVSATRSDDADSLLDADRPLPEPDDLSLLVDDLSLLVDDSSLPVDDLSLLIDDQSSDKRSSDLDDLYSLVEDTPQETVMDDLSLLLDSTPSDENSYDDLWTLVENRSDRTDDTPRVKDLPAPIEKAPKIASVKPDITPDQDLGKYKAAVMKIIIELKSLGLSAGQTTDRLNQDEVATLSGKPKWKENAISKIYGFIDSTK